MIEGIVKQINTNLDHSFKDKVLGIVYPVDNKGVKMPGERNGKTLFDAVPDSSKKSIVYWEEYGARKIDGTSRFARMAHNVRLIVWLNHKKLDTTTDACLEEMFRLVPRRIANTTIRLVGRRTRDESLFQRYTYDEEKQYITFPYDVFALDYEISYFLMKCK